MMTSACVSIGGADNPADRRFELLAARGKCIAADQLPATPIHFGIVRADSAVSNDRIVRRLTDSGEVKVLGGARWVSNAPRMLEDQIVRDLLNAQYLVQTANQRSSQQRNLKCELRDLSLHGHDQQDRAQISLSCALRETGSERQFNISKSTPLTNWSIRAAVAAMSQSYTLAFDNLCSELNK